MIDRVRQTAPRLWDHDWLILSKLRASIQQLLRHRQLLNSSSKIVDFGCGSRPYEALLKQSGCQYIACDLEGTVDVVITPGKQLDIPDASVSGVVSFQVLEHVWDIDWYLSECKRILKPGGWLLLSTHGTWLFHPHPTDFRRWTKDGLEAEITSRGFELQETQGIAGPLAWTLVIRLIAYREVLLKIPFIGKGLLNIAAILMNLRALLEDRVTPSAIRSSNASVYLTLSRKT